MSEKKSFKKILIANRGEIAIRIARTAKRLGIQTIGIYSEQDKKSQHLDFCDEVFSLGAGSIGETYLSIPKIIEAVNRHKADAVHPGYGFLSEREAFAESLEKNKTIFIGPERQSIVEMGDKIRSKEYMKKLGVPLVPGSDGAVKDLSQAKKIADTVGYPILLKASAGGGGKGMRVVQNSKELETALEAAAREAKNYFGDGTVFIEKYLTSPHHVEVQVMGDGKGGGGHVFDRECSVQRRHQKLLEESPSPLLLKYPKSKEKILEISNLVVEKMKYRGAGTLEYVADDEGNFYFLEMNTRLQVEHPVTEMVTGLDLVEYQIRVAQGESLKKGALAQAQRGHSFEVRIYSETPFDFLPTGGKILNVQFPQGPFVRVDSAIYSGYEVPTEYDPTLLKLVVWGETRTDALSRLQAALGELRILGVQSNQALFSMMCEEENFKAGNYGTTYLELHKKSLEEKFQKKFARHIQEFGAAIVALKNHSSANGAGLSVKAGWQEFSRRFNVEGTLL